MIGQLKVVVQLSGGADSTLAALRAIKRWPNARFSSVFVDYDQPYGLPEDAAVGRLHTRIFGRLDAGELHNINVGGLSTGSIEVPLRNLFLASLTATWAAMIGAEYIVVGSKTEDRFADSKPEFYSAVNAAIILGGRPIQIYQPLAGESKLDVYRELHDGHGILMSETMSCYSPVALDVDAARRFGYMYKECEECWHCGIKKNIAHELKYDSVWWRF